MKHVVLLPIIAVSVLASRTCFKSSRTVTYDGSDHEQVLQAPAADAGEWIKRLTPEKSLSHGFAELPPQTEWDAVLKHLRQPGEDPRTLKLRLLGDVLADDTEAASKDFRALLLTDADGLSSSYAREEALSFLHTFSKDSAETRQWIEKSLPKEKTDDHTGPDPADEITKLLNEDKVDEALAKLRSKIDSTEELSDKLRDLGKVVKIARLTDRRPLHEKALGEMKGLALKIPVDDVYGTYTFSDIFHELILRKDWQTVRQIATCYRGDHRASDFHSVCLVATYHIDGPAAFLKELRDSPKHGINDLNDYVDLLLSNGLGESILVGDYIVRSYIGNGEKENARTTLSYLLALQMGNDTYYRLAIECFPEDAEAIFEALRPCDPYQERPLIWLADLALRKNELERAQTLIDQAIALDPSDGEQGKDTRMQAYDVLSRLFRAKGDTEKADFFNDVMLAIRQGERADDYLEAGLAKEAIRRYEEALGRFSDAYCLQSRLAKTLLKAGEVEKAMIHFEKAFELMPVSFGPVESHCFGCEKIFEDERVRQVALKTFNRIIETTPENPRTFYLLGLLSEEMDLPDQALAAFKKALELDPKYYNCAKRLRDLQLRNPETIKDAQATQRKIAGMAPYQELKQAYQSRTDLRQAWLDAQTPPPAPLKLDPLPLPYKSVKKQNPSGSFSFYGDMLKPLDGWSTQELLDGNAFVEWIEDF